MKHPITCIIGAVLLAAGCHSTHSISGDTRTDSPVDAPVDTSADTAGDTAVPPDVVDVTPDPPPGCVPGSCPPTHFCEFPVGACDTGAPGVCVEIPTGGCADIWLPECGCDGVTYANECERRAAAQSMLHPGECDARVCAPWLEECDEGETCEVPPGSCDLDGVTGVCIPIRDDCGFLWDPQCGCDGVTYANTCERLKAHAWLDHPGECGDACGPEGYPLCAYSEFCEWPTSSCGEWGVGECITAPWDCLDIEDPVCGCDGHTYGNDCYRQQARVSLLHAGPC
jgi:hypothetical protein